MFDLFYRLFLLHELTLNEPYNKNYDRFLINCLATGIRSYRYDQFTGEVLFNNNIHFSFWNSNKYYAWLQDARFRNNSYPTTHIFNNGARNDVRFNHCRPSTKTMYRFNKALTNWLQSNLSSQESTPLELQDLERRIMSVQQNPLMSNIPSQADTICDLLEKCAAKEFQKPIPKISKFKYISES